MLDIRPPIAEAVLSRRPVVALESTLITHGLPRPLNRETAHAAEEAVRQAGAIPATIAVLDGRPTIGLRASEIDRLAEDTAVRKATRRDLAAAVAQRATASTTVAATMFLAHEAGIRFFATGGIGGAHRGSATTADVSADLWELARVPVAVVCAGAKSILDIPRTLEILETQGVPVVGYGTREFPGFYFSDTGAPVSCRVNSVEEACALLDAHWQFDGGGVVIAQPPPRPWALERSQIETLLTQAEVQAAQEGIRGGALTPFLLDRLAFLTEGKTLELNRHLVVANARLAGQLATAMARLT